MRKPSEQKVWATLLDKGEYYSGKRRHNFALFEFADGTRYTFEDMWGNLYKSLVENQSGVVVYTVTKGMYVIYTLRRFEIGAKQEDLPPLTAPPPTNDPPEPDEEEIEQILKHNNLVFKIVMTFSVLVGTAMIVALALDSIFGLIVSIFFILLLLSALIKDKVVANRFKAVSEKQKVATVTGKESGARINFLLADKTAISFSVPWFIYTTVAKGDSGLLRFKETGKRSLFIDFERHL